MTATAKTEFPPTAEQDTALERFKTGRSLAIEAGAGAGKTSTLILLARSTSRRGQYIAFNKAIVDESKMKMPSNVACSTAHSLAFRNVVSRNPRLAERLRNSRRMKSTEIAQRLRIEAIEVTVQDGTRKKLAASYLAGLVMRGVIRFCQSADLEPEARHVPYIDGIDLPPGAKANNQVVARALVAPMRRAWADITDDHGTLPFRHDHYLKMWHLSGPKINADFILFDEAQDANPVLVDIVRQQTHAQLVWVGDSQQQIYSFTGALNALQTVGADQRAFLTQSFRFGPAIAEQANRILDLLKAELRLTGTDTIDSVVAPVATPDVILCRTNATAVRAVLDALRHGQHPHLVGGGREVIDFAKAAQRLMNEGWTDHPELACFSSWDEVRLYVDQDEQGGDLRLLVNLIQEFGVDTIIDALERMPSEDRADLIVSTAHKSKGREWASVQLADDFPAEPQGEELRLLYVAITRAKRHLDITAVKLLNGGFDEPDQDDEPPAGTFDNGADGVPLETATLERETRIMRRHELPVPFANGYAPETATETRQERLERLRTAPADEVDALAAEITAEGPAPHSLEEHLAGVEGTFAVIANAGRTGRPTKLGTYDNSRIAIDAASALYGGGAFSTVAVIDEATGEQVATYDA